MVIAVNVKYFLKAWQQDYSKFICECFGRMANRQPQHTFIFFSDSKFDSSFRVIEKSIMLVIVPKIDAGMLSGILYNIKIASLLRKYKVNVFINADGFCSLFTKVRQGFILHNPASLFNNECIKKNHLFLYKKCLPYFLRRATFIVTESQISKNYILRQFKPDAQKLTVIYTAATDFPAPMEWVDKEQVKAQYAGGNEYFIFFGDTLQQNILFNLLKAFSHFKKWQKSGMQLCIVKKDTLPNQLAASLQLFKYRNDVKLLQSLPPNEFAKVAAAAYAVIYLPINEGFFITPLQAMKCNIPVITNNAGSMHEICGDAVLYVNFNDPEEIAQKLMLIFKDEKLRQELIEKGRITVQKYNWEKTTGLFWDSILKASS